MCALSGRTTLCGSIRAVLEALAVANRDLAKREIDVLHAEPKTSHDPHPAAVEETTEDCVDAAPPGGHGSDPFLRQHYGQAVRCPRPCDVLERT